MHKHQTYYHLIFSFIEIWTQENKGVTHPKKKKKSKPNTNKKNQPFYIFILYIQAVLLKCDHELGFNLANSQINSDSQITKEVENFHTN